MNLASTPRHRFDDEDPWTRAPVDLGTLDVDGMYWDLGFTLRVRFK